MNNKKIYHIAAEATLLFGLFYYASKKNNEIRQELYELEQDIEEVSEALQNTSNSNLADYNKVYQLQEKTKQDMEALHQIKQTLAHDVQELKQARELHESEKVQVENTLSEHIRSIRTRQQEQDAIESKQQAQQQAITIRLQQLEQRELSISQREKKHEQREKLLENREKQMDYKEKQMELRQEYNVTVPTSPDSQFNVQNQVTLPRTPEEIQALHLHNATQAMKMHHSKEKINDVLAQAAYAAEQVYTQSSSKGNVEQSFQSKIEELNGDVDEKENEIEDEIQRELQQLEEMESISRDKRQIDSRSISRSRPRSRPTSHSQSTAHIKSKSRK